MASRVSLGHRARKAPRADWRSKQGHVIDMQWVRKAQSPRGRSRLITGCCKFSIAQTRTLQLTWDRSFAWNPLVVVDVFVRAPDDHCNSNPKCIANPQKRRHGNRTTSFDLLPMASGESESNHILLAVATPLAEFLDALAKSFEKFDVIYHAATFYFCLTRNTTSRLAASASDAGLLPNVGHGIFVIIHSLNSMPGVTRYRRYRYYEDRSACEMTRS